MVDDDFMSEFFGGPLEPIDKVTRAPGEKTAAEKIAEATKSSQLFSQKKQEVISVDDDPEVIEALNAAAEAETKARIAEAALSQAYSPMQEIDKEEQELEKQIAALMQKKREIAAKANKVKEEILDARRAKNALEREAATAKRAAEVVRSNVLQQRTVQKSVESYRRTAELFPWFTGIERRGKTLKALPHQWEGIQFLASAKRAILGDGMGLGKTLTAIGALDLVESRRALIIVPADITSNFLREVKFWAPHRNVVNIKGMTKTERNAALSVATHFEPVVVIVNYEAWRRDLNLIKTLKEFRFDTVIADEAHTVKGTNTDAYSGVESIAMAANVCPLCNGDLVDEKCKVDGYRAGQHVPDLLEGKTQLEKTLVYRSAKNLWLMTGTPILNSPKDLFSMLHLMDPVNFPTASEYLRSYCDMDAEGKYYFQSGGLTSLMKKMSGRYLARTTETAGVILPPQEIIDHIVQIDPREYPQQLSILMQLKKHAQIVLSEDNKMSAMGVLALITRQRQAAVFPGGIQIWQHPVNEWGIPDTEQPKKLVFDAGDIRESIKIDKVMDLINEHSVVGGNRIAVFSQFKTGLAEIQRRLNKIGVRNVRFDGDTPNALKERVKTNFDITSGEPAEWEVVLANYRTGGTGLNLTAATHTIILDEEWNPGKRDQAYKRTQRMGQEENTFVHRIRLANSIDVWLANLIDKKEGMIAGFDDSTVDIQQEFLKAIREGEI